MIKPSYNLLINCDMGEWDAPHIIPCDGDIMPFIDLCNIACGGHAGTKQIIQSTLVLAKNNSVKIGAHPSFEDRHNFGRKYISLPKNKIINFLSRQLDLFLSICDDYGIIPHHIKAHGALYHACNKNKKEAEALINVVTKLCPNIIILLAPDSMLKTLADSSGISTMTESFIDRRYNDDLTLVSRTETDAVIQELSEAKKQYFDLSTSKITTKSGQIMNLETQTACIHGDNPQCVQILKSIRGYE